VNQHRFREKVMNKLAISQVAFHDRMALPAAGVVKLTAAVAALCANKLRRHLGASETISRAEAKDFEHSAPPDAWASSDSVWLTGFADSVGDDEVHVTLEVRADSAARDAEPNVLARGKLVFSVGQQQAILPTSALTAEFVTDRRTDYELRSLVTGGALTAAATSSRGLRTVRAYAASQALGAVVKLV
jgi:hypothetical protein